MDVPQLNGGPVASTSNLEPPAGGPPPAKRRKKAAGASEGPEEAGEKPKKPKSCHACRRVKLRCVVETEGEPCKRCAARGEECQFTTPLHDLKWQQTMTARVEYLSASVDFLCQAVGTLAHHLNLNVGAPPTPHPDAAAPLPVIATPPPPSASAPRALPLPPPPPKPESKDLRPEQPEIDQWDTRAGAEQLLAQAYASFPSPFGSSHIDGSVDGSAYAQSNQQQRQVDAPEAPSFFGLIDFGLESPELSARTAEQAAGDSLQASKSMAARLLGSTNLEAVGSSDPRMDVVKHGLISVGDAEVLVDFFQAHLAPHVLGFPMQLRSWPFLPAGKSTITPLILGSICLISAERIPAYHSTVARLAASDLGESILDATPGLSWAKDSEGKDRVEGGGSEKGIEEPDLDLELGIGPEEISALLLYASFSCSPKSDVIARTGFEWCRGHLRSFMLPCPPPVTYGEVFGLLPARRHLTFENWLRLWLFGYIVDVQQSLHHESRAPVFDPAYFCDTLLLNSRNSTDPAEQQRDRELAAHARLCAILQRVQYTRSSAGFSQSSAPELINAYEGWSNDLHRWWSLQNFFPLVPGSTEPLTTPTLHPDIALTLFRLFASVYVNLAAAQEPRLSEDPARWRFRARSVGAAYDMLSVVGDERIAKTLNLLFPFYVKMISLAAVVLLDAYQDSVFIGLPCTLEQSLNAVARVADNLANAPVSVTHVCITASSNLKRLIVKTENALRRG